MRNLISWAKNNWWVILILAMVIVATLFALSRYSSSFEHWADVVIKALTPISIILGIILGYPMLKKKLTDGYISKQFDIISTANREVRHRVLSLQDKYQIKGISNTLTLKHIDEIVDDMNEVMKSAIDASSDVYRYCSLVYNALKKIQSIYSQIQDEDYPHFYYKEELGNWFNAQLREIYDFTRSLGNIPNGEVVSRARLNTRLAEFVTGNDLTEIKNMAHSIDYYQNEAMLVLFFALGNYHFSVHNVNFFTSCYEVAPSPASFARLLYNSSVYFPPVITLTQETFFLQHPELLLVGYKRRTSHGANGSESYYVCFYANISNVSFVRGLISSFDDMNPAKDGYLDTDFSFEGCSELEKHRECITFKIPVSIAEENYRKIAYRLQSKLKSEMK